MEVCSSYSVHYILCLGSGPDLPHVLQMHRSFRGDGTTQQVMGP
jgi:hypothetical protein